MALPRIFIGSSAESLNVTQACNVCLDYKAEPSLWPQIFEPGGGTLQTLTDKANEVDFALFIFSPDDVTKMRTNTLQTVRDNVLFELGLFIGSLGQERCFVLKPRNAELHMPTDLLGLNTLSYNAERTDGDLESAVSAACSKVLTQMDKLGHFEKKTKDFSKVGSKHKTYELDENCFRLMIHLIETMTSVDAIADFTLKSKCSGINELTYNVSLIKLLRSGLVEKTNESDYHGNEWYGYRLTADGVEYVLENESKFNELMYPRPQVAVPGDELPVDFDDDKPF
ncbi:TIR domain-containing protein [Vibrio maritimus]|uniref:TIR domain-containing protein n=1 Tax=Vibrio maritimus TaxID=990268 RepID=UPI001F4302DC|nr:nucleotide-binding protein [Vibrio maritimus]